MQLKIKNRKVELRQIAVPMIGNTLRIIHVTPKQLEKLATAWFQKEGSCEGHNESPTAKEGQVATLVWEA